MRKVNICLKMQSGKKDKKIGENKTELSLVGVIGLVAGVLLADFPGCYWQWHNPALLPLQPASPLSPHSA